MAFGGAAPRKLGWYFYLILSLGQGPRLASVASAWTSSWWANRSSIMVFAAINTAITMGTEFVTRDVLHSVCSAGDAAHGFLIPDEEWGYRIHKQSMINVLMTLFASLLGGPVYFFRTRSSRWLFFIGFGMFNSALAQTVLSLFRGVGMWLDPHRVLFDMIYSGTLKFFMFEVGRRYIVSLRHKHKSVVRVGSIRVGQDLTMTYIRVFLLNLFGFRG